LAFTVTVAALQSFARAIYLIILVALCNRTDHYIFILFLSSSFFFFFFFL